MNAQTGTTAQLILTIGDYCYYHHDVNVEPRFKNEITLTFQCKLGNGLCWPKHVVGHKSFSMFLVVRGFHTFPLLRAV
jgi:hypothetical protein